jgi:hypothetical protein
MTLLERGGVAVIRGLLGGSLQQQLLAEALERLAEAEQFITRGRNLEWRGGNPARVYRATAAGMEQAHIFGGKPMTDALSDLCGVALRSSGTGSYTYYHDTGDYLALHRDIVQCEIATITCLEDDGPEAYRGGLRAYPDYSGRPLIDIYYDRPRGIDLPTRPGDTIVIAGGVVPHEVTPIVPRQRRTVALACYAPKGG